MDYVTSQFFVLLKVTYHCIKSWRYLKHNLTRRLSLTVCAPAGASRRRRQHTKGRARRLPCQPLISGKVPAHVRGEEGAAGLASPTHLLFSNEVTKHKKRGRILIITTLCATTQQTNATPPFPNTRNERQRMR